MNEGWRCPLCGTVYGPHVDKCGEKHEPKTEPGVATITVTPFRGERWYQSGPYTFQYYSGGLYYGGGSQL